MLLELGGRGPLSLEGQKVCKTELRGHQNSQMTNKAARPRGGGLLGLGSLLMIQRRREERNWANSH